MSSIATSRASCIGSKQQFCERPGTAYYDPVDGIITLFVFIINILEYMMPAPRLISEDPARKALQYFPANVGSQHSISWLPGKESYYALLQKFVDNLRRLRLPVPFLKQPWPLVTHGESSAVLLQGHRPRSSSLIKTTNVTKHHFTSRHLRLSLLIGVQWNAIA